MSFWGPVAAAGIGVLGNLFGSSGDRESERQESSMPQWSPRQLPYLFSGDAWQPQTPMFNPYSLNYAGGLMGGYNPAYGPQQSMGFGSLLASLGGGPGASGRGLGGLPWYMDPSGAQQQGGLAGLLGYGQGAPPPALMNSPFFGHGVASPEMLHGMPGAGLPQQQQQAQPQQQAGPVQPPAWQRPPNPVAFQGAQLPWWAGQDARQARMTELPSQVIARNQQRDADLNRLAGRNIADLTPEELAILGIGV